MQEQEPRRNGSVYNEKAENMAPFMPITRITNDGARQKVGVILTDEPRFGARRMTRDTYAD